MAYIRFVTNWTTHDDHQECGLLAAACDIRDQFLMQGSDFFELCEQVDWFTENLDIPPMLGDPSFGKTESWFLAEAHDHILRAQSLAALLERAIVQTTVHKRKILDNVVYRDAHQILAKVTTGTYHHKSS